MKPRDIDPDKVRELLANGSNEPLEKIFSDLVAAAPSYEDMATWSKTRVDRYSQALVTVGKMVGRSAPDTQVNVFNFEGMSDMDMTRRIAELHAERGASGADDDVTDALPPASPPKGLPAPTSTQAQATPLATHASVDSTQHNDKQTDTPTPNGPVSTTVTDKPCPGR